MFMLTGQELFTMWVQSCLCTDCPYWEQLTEVRRKNWEVMADKVNAKADEAIEAAHTNGIVRGGY